MAFSFLQRGNPAELARQLSLTSYEPLLVLEQLSTGIDNVRHDVFLSPRFSDAARAHIFKLIAKHGNVEELLAEPLPGQPHSAVGRAWDRRPVAKAWDPADFKRQLADLHVGALNQAKAENNVNIDLLFRLAAVKFQRAELVNQYSVALERCRARIKQYEGPRHSSAKTVEIRERFAQFQINKKAVLRRAGQDLFFVLRDVEKESLSRTRRSLFGDAAAAAYELLLNRLLFTEDGQDNYLNAEHYVLLGNYERDRDRLQTIQQIAGQYFKTLGIVSEASDPRVDTILNVPENAQEIMGNGSPDESSEKAKIQKSLLNTWVGLLEQAGVMETVLASYEVVPLLAQYSPPINPQQLKNALISREELKRVEALLEQHGKLSPEALYTAGKKIAGCKPAERARLAGRFFTDFVRYHRDLRRMEAVVSAMDTVNVISNERFRELSSINHTLYEFLLSEEQRPAEEEKVIRHVILKADIRESTTLTRTLFERGLNPASYFSLNFYDPINKLLPKYGAKKVFIEGDAIILALFEREGEAGTAVGHACMLAKEMIEIVTAYNEQSRSNGLPVLELGIGICYQDSAPMYLMDGNKQIMISKAINESDRLSSCSKGVRHVLEQRDLLFNVFSFKTVEDSATGGEPSEFLLRYNIGGIHINEAAFQKLRSEISLQGYEVHVPMIWKESAVRVYSGSVPLGQGVFHPIIVREGRIAHVDPRDFSLTKMTDTPYYEVCVNPRIYAAIEGVQKRPETAMAAR
jgi:class 3 adenylate cyclase